MVLVPICVIGEPNQLAAEGDPSQCHPLLYSLSPAIRVKRGYDRAAHPIGGRQKSNAEQHLLNDQQFIIHHNSSNRRPVTIYGWSAWGQTGRKPVSSYPLPGDKSAVLPHLGQLSATRFAHLGNPLESFVSFIQNNHDTLCQPDKEGVITQSQGIKLIEC